MPLDAASAALKEQLDAAQAPPVSQLPLDLTREGYRAAQPLAPEIEVGAVEDRRLPTDVGEVPVRIYRPAGSGPFGISVFYHGGGWTLGDLDTHDYDCRMLCREAGVIVVAVDYRLAPEHRFPAAVDDAYAALAWVDDHKAGLDGAGPLSVCGDSAGGNLATVMCLLARDRGGPAICQQVLFYPVVDAGMNTPSYAEVGEGYWLNRDTMIWFWDQYCPDSTQRSDPRASPLRAASHADLPPALIITAQYDPLRDEAEDYARAMDADGVPVTLQCVDGVMHSFVSLGRIVPAGRAALEQAASILRAAHA